MGIKAHRRTTADERNLGGFKRMMKAATRAIEEFLEARFGMTEARAIMFGRARVVRMDIQFMDVKHMSELCERYRGKLRGQIKAYRQWEAAQETETDPVARLYNAAEGAALSRRISDEMKLWYFAHRDYHAMRRAYMIKCVGPHIRVEWGKVA